MATSLPMRSATIGVEATRTTQHRRRTRSCCIRSRRRRSSPGRERRRGEGAASCWTREKQDVYKTLDSPRSGKVTFTCTAASVCLVFEASHLVSQSGSETICSARPKKNRENFGRDCSGCERYELQMAAGSLGLRAGDWGGGSGMKGDWKAKGSSQDRMLVIAFSIVGSDAEMMIPPFSWHFATITMTSTMMHTKVVGVWIHGALFPSLPPSFQPPQENSNQREQQHTLTHCINRYTKPPENPREDIQKDSVVSTLRSAAGWPLP
jgi:hypothetical protein